jgi:hypothetical protein
VEEVARRISIALVVLLALLAGASSAHSGTASVLVQYSFDDGSVETGPDTFAVFQKARGSVRLDQSNRFSGYRSIEIRDVAGDKDFPELQGYFPLQNRGLLYVHFALMTANPQEELNVALAGPEWFTLRRNGIGFWLKTIDGHLCHYSDSIPKKLFPIQPFVWYIVDAAYDIENGRYDLVIREEGKSDPIASLREQPNAANQPGSAVDKFSFIGDPGTDESQVTYYVDDVIVSAVDAATPGPFVAPGRRKLFFDYWLDHQRSVRSRIVALPAMDLSDLGIRATEVDALRRAGLWDVMQAIVEGRSVQIPQNVESENKRLFESVLHWRAGVEELQRGNAAAALEHFDAAEQLAPAGKIFEMDAVLSLAALGQWNEVDVRLSRIYSVWRDDLRFPVAAAMIGVARQDIDGAERSLRSMAEQAFRDPTKEILAEQYFHLLLWQKQPAIAEQFAERMVEGSRERGSNSSLWLERLGDAAFVMGDFGTALRQYEASLAVDPGNPVPRVLLKLSDVQFRLGNLDQERMYRETIYGRLQ